MICVSQSNDLSMQLLESISERYLNPQKETADSDGCMKLNILAEEFSITWMKARKRLITVGVYESPISIQINRLKAEGKTVQEIKAITGLSNAAICGYLPYEKVIYNLEQPSDVAERIKLRRHRKPDDSLVRGKLHR